MWECWTFVLRMMQFRGLKKESSSCVTRSQTWKTPAKLHQIWLIFCDSLSGGFCIALRLQLQLHHKELSRRDAWKLLGEIYERVDSRWFQGLVAKIHTSFIFAFSSQIEIWTGRSLSISASVRSVLGEFLKERLLQQLYSCNYTNCYSHRRRKYHLLLISRINNKFNHHVELLWCEEGLKSMNFRSDRPSEQNELHTAVHL